MKILKNLFIFFLLLFLYFSLIKDGFTIEECTNLSEIECINKLEGLKNAENAKGNTLAAEIDYMDTQIYLTTLEIKQTEKQILDTQEEIETLGGRIQGVNDSLDYLTKLLFNKIKEGYKRRDVPLFNIFLDSESASPLLNQLKYTKIAQENDRRVAYQLQQAKQNFEDQKDLREKKVQELDALK